MKVAIEVKRFDYRVVDDDSRRKLISLAGDIHRTKKTGLQAMLEMGKSISVAQELLADHGGGTFGAWVEHECGIARQTAYNYMNAWGKFNGCQSLGQLTAEAMYLLAAPKTPEAAYKNALKSAENGVKVTEAVAKQIIRAVTPPRDNTPRQSTPKTRPEQASDDTPATKVEPEEEAEPEAIEAPARQWGDGDTLDDVQADLRELAARCKSLSLFARKILRCEGNDIKRPYCKMYSLTTLSHPLLHVARCITNDLPVGGTPAKPILYHQEKARSLV